MITTQQMLKIFSLKLDASGSFDDAFTKAIWVAYLHGLSEGAASTNPSRLIVDADELIKKATENVL